MRPVIVLVAAALIGCVSSREPQRRVKRTAEDVGGARFFARGTAGDRHELRLQKLTVDARTQPGTVRSHLTMEVATAAAGLSEAIIRLPVPIGAAVTDAVLWVNDRPMRGAFVPRARATAIYTSIVSRRRDPALVTWDGPGWVAVSIFPLESNRPRRFELTWVEPAAVIDGQVTYRIPLVAEGDRVIGRASLEVDGRRVRGARGELVAIAPADGHQVYSRRAPGDPFQQVMVRDASPVGPPHFVLVVETSAAMTPSLRLRQRAMLGGLLAALPRDAKLTVLSADWDVSTIVEEAAAAAWPGALGKLDAVPSAGAFHLERVVREAAACALKAGAGAVLLVGLGRDAFPGDAITGAAEALRDARLRLSVVEVMGDVPPALARTVSETGGISIAERELDRSRRLLVETLRPRAGRPVLDARGEGEWHLLRTVTGEGVWMGRVLEPQSPAGVEVARAEADSPFASDLASLWERAHLAWSGRDGAEEIARVLTPATSLLVLETAQDYRRVGLEGPEEGRGPRDNPDPGLAQRLSEEAARNAGLMGVLGMLRQTDASSSSPAADASLGGDGDQIGEDQTLGGLALGGRRAKAPEVIPGTANVRGSLDPQIIRRVIRRHINEVKDCYEQELTKKPGLGGRIVVELSIAASGHVLASVLQSSTMGNPRVETCTVEAVRRWEFPAPLGGGLVVVSFPFVLTPVEPRASRTTMPIDEALATLAQGAGRAQIERISSLLGLRKLTSAEALAWTIDRRAASFPTRQLVARLLEVCQRHRDAIRVLTESAADAPSAVAGQLRAFNADADADEVLRLARR